MDGPTPIMPNQVEGEEVSPFESKAAREVTTELEAIKQIKLLGQEGRLTFNWNYHHRSRVFRPKFPAVYNTEFYRDFGPEIAVVDGLSFSLEQAEQVLSACRTPGRETPTPIFKCTNNLACSECGKDLELVFNGRDIYTNTRCRYPSGFPEIKAVISVPSGKLLFANFFSGVPETKGPGAGAVGRVALKHETRHHAKYNVAYATCGNNAPRIFVHAKRDRIIIGRPAVDPKTNEEIPIATSWPDYKLVGSITTDAPTWAAACEDTVRMFDDKTPIVAKVKILPGQYRVTQQYHLSKADNLNNPAVFGMLERIGR